MKGYCIAQSHKYLFIWVIKEGFLKGGNSGLDLYIYQHVRKQPKLFLHKLIIVIIIIHNL